MDKSGQYMFMGMEGAERCDWERASAGLGPFSASLGNPIDSKPGFGYLASHESFVPKRAELESAR